MVNNNGKVEHASGSIEFLESCDVTDSQTCFMSQSTAYVCILRTATEHLVNMILFSSSQSFPISQSCRPFRLGGCKLAG